MPKVTFEPITRLCRGLRESELNSYRLFLTFFSAAGGAVLNCPRSRLFEQGIVGGQVRGWAVIVEGLAM